MQHAPPTWRDCLWHQAPWLHLSIPVALYLLLLLPTLGRQGIGFDEQTDLNVTMVYLEQLYGWLVGTHIDASQARLPMALVAAVFGITGGESLVLARLITAAAGLLVLAGVYCFCRRRLSHATGVIACMMLATSPFFLSFARVAWTASDVLLACALVWLMVAMERLRDAPTLGRAAAAGVLLGLAVAVKVTALAILPAIWAVLLLSGARSPPIAKRRAPYTAVVAAVVLIVGGGWLVRSTPPGQPSLLLLRYLLVLAGWIALLAWCYRRRRLGATPVALALLVTSIGMLTAFVLPPEHIANPQILAALADRANDEMGFEPGFILEAGALHILCILIKSTPLLGAALLLGVVAAAAQWRTKPGLRLPLLTTACYFGGLLILPLAQTFYTIPLLPLLSIFAADALVRLHRRHRIAAVALGAAALAIWSHDVVRSYPDYNLTGYHWTGRRILAGRPSMGAQSVVQVSTDGLEQALAWLETHVPPGRRVDAFLLAWHIVADKAPHPPYRLRDGMGKRATGDPDYLLSTLNVTIPQSWWAKGPVEGVVRPPYDPAWLHENYEKVFTVRRAYGIEVATIWKRR